MKLNNDQTELVELVRILENTHYTFLSDDIEIKNIIKQQDNLSWQEKLYQRAVQLDRDGKIQQTINHIWLQLKLTLWLLRVVFFFGGMSVVWTVMSSGNVNIFYLLFSFLGLNTLIFLVWLVFFFSPNMGQKNWIIRLLSSMVARGQAGTVRVAWLNMWQQHLSGRGLRFLSGVLSHQFWLYTLSGMLIAFLWRLLVHEYTFTWQSTLLYHHEINGLVQKLGWLPEKFGFLVPNNYIVVISHDNGYLEVSRQWASFLAGCMLVYGIVPRLIAWGICFLGLRRYRILKINENLPYYFGLNRLWNTRVVDEDTTVQDNLSTQKTQSIQIDNTIKTDAQKWACTLEATSDNPIWFDGVLGQTWQDCGVIQNEAQLEALHAMLKTQNVQLLVGIRENSLPERGLIRQLRSLKENAQSGVMVMILLKPNHTLTPNRKEQWQQALQSLNIGLLNL